MDTQPASNVYHNVCFYGEIRKLLPDTILTRTSFTTIKKPWLVLTDDNMLVLTLSSLGKISADDILK